MDLLGIEISINDSQLKISQQNYIQKIIEKFNMENAKPVTTPAAQNISSVNIESKIEDKALDEHYKKIYLQIVGSLLYAQRTRPDITFAVNQLARYLHDPKSSHFTGAKRVLRYLRGTNDKCIVMTDKNGKLEAFSDSTFAEPPDRKSTTGYTLFLSGLPVSYASKRQPIIARSTAEAEYYALGSCTNEVLVARYILQEIHPNLVSEPTTIYVDNQSTIAMATTFTTKSRTIDVQYKSVMDYVNKDIILKYISTNENPADMFTKPLSQIKHERFTMMCGVQGGVLESHTASYLTTDPVPDIPPHADISAT
jgi:hypothetical protein